MVSSEDDPVVALVMLTLVIVFNDALQNNPNVAKSTAEAVLSVLNPLIHVLFAF